MKGNYIDASEGVECLDERVVVVLASLARGRHNANEQVSMRVFRGQRLEFIGSQVAERASHEQSPSSPTRRRIRQTPERKAEEMCKERSFSVRIERE